jgi:hypothetical protein
MRAPTIIPLATLLAGCLAPGERDPTRYPWDPRNKVAMVPAPHPPLTARGAIPPLADPRQQFVPPRGTYCVVAIEPQGTTGITVGGKAPGIMTCSPLPNPAPGSPPR